MPTGIPLGKEFAEIFMRIEIVDRQELSLNGTFVKNLHNFGIPVAASHKKFIFSRIF